MKQVPFNTDDLKLKYIDSVAAQYICVIQEEARAQCITPIFQKKVSRVMVKDVQDLFIVEYFCKEVDKKIEIEKFFLPNSIFENNYFKDIEAEAQKSIDIDGHKVINELLSWGRLTVK